MTEYKEFRTKQEETEDDNILTFVASTPTKDNHGDVVEPEGWEFRDHIPFLWGHSAGAQEPPSVGEVIDPRIKDEQLVVDVRFDVEDPLGKELLRKYKNNFLSSVSVGFTPLETESLAEGRHHFLQQRLVEVSAVNVGSNRDAGLFSKEGRVLSQDSRELIKDARDALDELLERSAKEAFLDNMSKEVPELQEWELASRETEWDSSAAVNAWREFSSSEDEPSDEYREGFFWYDEENPQLFTSYKLPYVDVIDGEVKAVPRALFAVAAALEGARGGVEQIPDGELQEIREQVSAWYDKMGDDVVAPWDTEDSFDVWFSEQKEVLNMEQKRLDLDMLVELYPELRDEDPEDLEEIRDEINEAVEEILAGFLEEDPSSNSEKIKISFPDGSDWSSFDWG